MVVTFRQIYMLSSEYNLNYKTSILNILYNTFYSRSKLKLFIMRYNYVIILRTYYAIIIQSIHSIHKQFSSNTKVGLNKTVNNRLSCMIKAISLNAYRPIFKQI